METSIRSEVALISMKKTHKPDTTSKFGGSHVPKMLLVTAR